MTKYGFKNMRLFGNFVRLCAEVCGFVWLPSDKRSVLEILIGADYDMIFCLIMR